MNQRTRETKYYEIPGAEEFSAMESAEGQVQNLAYTAAFPLLLNIADEPTYLIALKDNAGLVKKYAMVNIQKYQNVAIGDTVSQCEEKYLELLVDNGMLDDEKAAQSSEEKEAKGVISRMAQAVVEGNTHYYLMLENEDRIYDVPITDFLGIVKYDVGDTITLTYIEGEPACEVTSVTGASGDARAEIETESTEEETDETAAESEETQS